MISKEVGEMTAMVQKLQNTIKVNRELLNQVQNGKKNKQSEQAPTSEGQWSNFNKSYTD